MSVAELVAGNVGPFDKASVRKTLHDGSRGQKPRFRRIGWGLYEHVPEQHRRGDPTPDSRVMALATK